MGCKFVVEDVKIHSVPVNIGIYGAVNLQFVEINPVPVNIEIYGAENLQFVKINPVPANIWNMGIWNIWNMGIWEYMELETCSLQRLILFLCLFETPVQWNQL